MELDSDIEVIEQDEIDKIPPHIKEESTSNPTKTNSSDSRNNSGYSCTSAKTSEERVTQDDAEVKSNQYLEGKPTPLKEEKHDILPSVSLEITTVEQPHCDTNRTNDAEFGSSVGSKPGEAKQRISDEIPTDTDHKEKVTLETKLNDAENQPKVIENEYQCLSDVAAVETEENNSATDDIYSSVEETSIRSTVAGERKKSAEPSTSQMIPFSISHDLASRGVLVEQTRGSDYNTEVKVPVGSLPPEVDYVNCPTCNERSEIKKGNYLELMKTFEGLLFVGEITCAMLSWILLVVWSTAGKEFYLPCPLGYSLFAYVASFAITSLWFVILLTGADEKVVFMVMFREPPFGLAYNVVWALAYLIAGSIAASYAVSDLTQVLGASTAFAFVVLTLHISHGLVYFYRRYGLCPWHLLQGCNKECSSASI